MESPLVIRNTQSTYVQSDWGTRSHPYRQERLGPPYRKTTKQQIHEDQVKNPINVNREQIHVGEKNDHLYEQRPNVHAVHGVQIAGSRIDPAVRQSEE